MIKTNSHIPALDPLQFSNISQPLKNSSFSQFLPSSRPPASLSSSSAQLCSGSQSQAGSLLRGSACISVWRDCSSQSSRIKPTNLPFKEQRKEIVFLLSPKDLIPTILILDTKHWSYARPCSKHFTYVLNSFILHSHPMGKILVLWPFYRWGHRGAEVNCPYSHRAEIQAKAHTYNHTALFLKLRVGLSAPR